MEEEIYWTTAISKTGEVVEQEEFSGRGSRTNATLWCEGWFEDGNEHNIVLSYVTDLDGCMIYFETHERAVWPDYEPVTARYQKAMAESMGAVH